MFRRFILVLITICWLGRISAQVTVSLQVPPVGVVQKSQLWNMVLVYTGEAPLRVYVGLSFLSVKDNRPLMTATTRPFILTKGAKQVSAADIAPVQYNYYSSIFDVDRSPDGFLPIGNFKACYTIYKDNKTETSPVAEDCLPIEVQPLSPPLLNTPADTASIDNHYPQFTWLPVVPTNLFSNLNYDLLLVEVMPGQTPGDAIQNNLPVTNIANTKNPFFNYAASYKALDTNRIYAWRVVAKNDDEFVTQSEVWTFKIKPVKLANATPLRDGYVLLHNDLQGIYQIKENLLHVKYFSYDKTHNSIVTFTEENGDMVYQESKEIIQGDNYFDFKISSRFQKGKIYLITVTSLDNKRQVLRFTLLKNQ